MPGHFAEFSMRPILAFAFLVVATMSSVAADRKLTGPEINAALTDTTVYQYRSTSRPWRQYFAADGATPYYGSDGPVSHGKWQVRGDQYCSLWPPSSAWSCYDVTTRVEHGKTIVTWIPASGGSSVGIVYPGNLLDQVWPPE